MATPMKFCFDEKSLSLLRRAGWHSQRNVKTDLYLLNWCKDGYTVFPHALEFARSFGGIHLAHRGYGSDAPDESHFDPSVATRRFDRAWAVDKYEGLAKEILIPVGQGYSGHLTFLIGTQGGFYGGYDDYFCRIGETVEEALANILFGRAFEKLPG